MAQVAVIVVPEGVAALAIVERLQGAGTGAGNGAGAADLGAEADDATGGIIKPLLAVEQAAELGMAAVADAALLQIAKGVGLYGFFDAENSTLTLIFLSIRMNAARTRASNSSLKPSASLTMRTSKSPRPC